MLTTILDSGASWHEVAPKFVPNTSSSQSNASAVLPGGAEYVLKNGTILYKTKRETVVVDKDDDFAGALAVSPDKSQLVVSRKHSHWLYDYIIQPGGTLTDKQTLYWLHNPGNDDSTAINSLAFDTDGDLLVATSIGVQVCDQNGRVRAILSVPGGPVTVVWFGGDKLNILFAECGSKLYQRNMHVTGAPSASKPRVPESEGGG